MSDILSFHRPPTAPRGWSQQELAEFYRVEAALVRAGLPIDSEQGLSDEAEPWFVFCRPDGAPIMHFARIGGRYVVASEVLDGPLWGEDFRGLINQVAQRHPELLPIRHGSDGTRITVHPAALLAALVAAAAVILSSEEAVASEAMDHEVGAAAAVRGEPSSAPRPEGTAKPDDREDHRKQFEALVVSAMIFAAFAAEAAAAGAGQEATADPQARVVATPDAAGEALTFSTPDGPAHKAGPGAQHAAVSGSAAPSGSGSAAQPGVAAAARTPGLDPAPDAPGRPTSAPADLHASSEPNGHVVLRTAEAGSTRAGGTAAPAEPGPERGAGASSAAGAVETAGGLRAEAEDAAPQSRSHAATSALQDTLSSVTVRIERLLHRGTDNVTVAGAEPGRGPAKVVEESRGIEGPKASDDAHPGRGHAKHSDERADKSNTGHRDRDGDHGQSGPGTGGEDGPSDPRGSKPVAAAEAGSPRADPAPSENRNDPGRSGVGRSDGVEHGEGKANAETKVPGSDRAQAAESSGKGNAGMDPSSDAGTAKADSDEHGGAAAAAASRSENKSAADHAQAAEHPGKGNAGAGPSFDAGTAKADSDEHGGAAAAAASRQGNKSAADHAQQADEHPGKGNAGAGPSSDAGTAKADSDEHAGAAAAAASRQGNKSGADHAQADEHPGKGLGPHDADAGDPVEQASARPRDSGVAASGHGSASEPSVAHDRAAAEPLGLDGEAPGKAMGRSPDRTASADHEKAGPGAASQGAPTTHLTGDPADVGSRKGDVALGTHGEQGPAAGGAGSGPQPAPHDSAASHPPAGQSPAKSFAASLDRDGNIVFASDAAHVAGPAASHGTGPAPVHAPTDGGAHVDVGLVGMADHAGPAHHLDFHS